VGDSASHRINREESFNRGGIKDGKQSVSRRKREIWRSQQETMKSAEKLKGENDCPRWRVRGIAQ